MDIRKFDLVIIITMTVAIVSMSFVFPALGLTDSSTSESDIPEFDMEPNRFDMVGDFPDNPGTPSQGELEVMEQQGSEVTLHSGSDEEVVLTAINPTSTPNLTAEVHLIKYNSSGTFDQNVSLDSEGDTNTISAHGYSADLEWQRTESVGTEDETVVVTYQLTDQPGGEGWLTRVPIVGGIISAGEALAAIVGWIGSVIWWGIAFVFQMGINVLGMVFDIAVYFTATLSWLVNTYAAVISSANAWAAVFVSIPGILLFGEFGKIVMVLISLLPTT